MNGPTRTRPRNVAVLLAVLFVLASVAQGAPVTLTNGVPVTGISGAAGSEKFYIIEVPAGQDELDIVITGGTGDCDLYVRKDSPPTTMSYDYRPYEVGNEETVHVDSPAAGTWHIMLRGYSAYSGLTLEASYSAATSIVPLTNGVPKTGLAAAQGTQQSFRIEVPAGQSKLEISISGGSGDCDLYVKRGALPTTSDYDYRPFLFGNDETVTINSPAGGTWYIMLNAYDAYSGVTLLASYGGGVGTILTNGVPVTDISGAQASERIYRIDVPIGQTNLEIMIWGGTGDCDLYVKRGARPMISDYDYRPFLPGSDETVTINSPAAGTWYIMLRGYSPYSGVSLQATYGDVFTLQDGVPVPNLSGPLNSETFFKIVVPSGQDTLLFRISGGTGNADMYIKRGAKPTTSDWDFRPYQSGNNESVSIGSPEGGQWYIMLRARQAYAGVALEADYSFSGSVRLIDDGVPVPDISGDAGSEQYYRLEVPSGLTSLEIKIFGGTGDADMYIKREELPTVSDYDYRPYVIGNDETVTISNPAGGSWFIMIRGYQPFSGVTLLATFDGGGGGGEVVLLENGVPVTGIAGAVQSEKFYKVEVPAGQAKLEIMMSGGSGDADLYVRKGSQPTATEWDYRPYMIGNDETVTVDSPAAGTWFIMIRAYTAYTGVTLKATYFPVPDTVTELDNGVPIPGISGAAGNERFYKIDVPADQDFLQVKISGGTGDCDLYVRKGAKPTTTSWDYRPYDIGNNETVDIINPAVATWYVMLRGYQAYTGVTLVATYGASGNSFASDPNCVAVWRFEDGELTTDSVGSNTLAAQHNPVADTSDFKEGEASLDTTVGYLSIADSDLSEDFPLRSTDTNKNITVTFWMNASQGNSILPGSIIFGKGGEPGKYSLAIGLYESAGAGTGRLRVSIGVLGGTNHEILTNTSKVLQRNQWYHVAVSYKTETSGAVRMRIYDPSDDSVEVTSVWTSQPINLSKSKVTIGAYRYSANRYYGLIDELAVFNDILTDTEIDQIRQGSYGKP